MDMREGAHKTKHDEVERVIWSSIDFEAPWIAYLGLNQTRCVPLSYNVIKLNVDTPRNSNLI